MGSSARDKLTWKQASLKIKLGGFGTTNLTQTSAAAFVGSWCYSMSTIPQRFPSRIDLCDSLDCANPPPFYQHLFKAIASLPSTLGSDGETLIPQSLSGLRANSVKLENHRAVVWEAVVLYTVRCVQSLATGPTVWVLQSIFATHGILEIIVSDNGSAVTSQEFSKVVQTKGIVHITTAPYHPSSNGLVERAVQPSRQL